MSQGNINLSNPSDILYDMNYNRVSYRNNHDNQGQSPNLLNIVLNAD